MVRAMSGRPVRFSRADSLEFMQTQWALAPWDRAELDQARQCCKPNKGLTCTKTREHGGDHIAHSVSEGRAVYRWGQDEEREKYFARDMAAEAQAERDKF